jgi:hypothetical protein
MKLAALALALAACGGSQAPATTSTTTSTSSSSSSSPTAVQASAGTSSPSPTMAPGGTVNKRPDYSCFSYTSRNSKDQRTACMRTADCGPYLDQAKQVGGIVEVSGCANASVVFCFATGDEEVCQPTLESCTSERALLVKKGTSVTGDCTRI